MQKLVYFHQVINENSFKVPKTSADGSTVSNIVLPIVFGVAGAIAVFFVAFGGFKYVISGGDPQAVSKAKNQILYGIIGLVVAVSAYALVGFVMQRI